MEAQNLADTADDAGIRILYKNLLHAWNMADAKTFAAFFDEAGFIVGFDGTDVKGKSDIEKHLAGIFAQHKTASYVSIVRSIQSISPDIVILFAVAGMVPPGKSEINPATNAVQTAVIKKSGNEYRLILFQNTPAAYHGRPGASEQLTRELQKQLSFSRDAQ